MGGAGGSTSDAGRIDTVAGGADAGMGNTLLGMVAAQMAPGSWRLFQTSGLTRDLLYIDANGKDGSTAHTDWSDELSWDPRSKTVYYIGAGHLRAYGFLQYKAESNQWIRQDKGLPPCMYLGNYEGCFNHGYDNAALDVASGTLYFNSHRRLFAYDTTRATWTESRLPDSVPAGYASASEFFPGLGLAIVLGGAIVTVDPQTKVVTPIATGLPMGPYSNVTAYSDVHRTLFFGGGNGSRKLHAMDKDRRVTALPDAPDIVHVGMTTLTTDPVSGDLLFLSTLMQLHSYDPTTRTWRLLGDAPFMNFAAPRSEVMNGQVNHHVLAAPIATSGVTMFVLPSDRYEVYLYKHR